MLKDMGIFKKGDIIVSDHAIGVERKILRRFKGNKYAWCYPDMPEDKVNYFLSSNSSDPTLFYWKLKP